MPQQFLDRPDVVAVFEKVSGEGMAEGMTGDIAFLRSAWRAAVVDRALEDGFVEMVPKPAPVSGSRYAGAPGKSIASPKKVASEELPCERFGEFDVAVSAL